MGSKFLIACSICSCFLTLRKVRWYFDEKYITLIEFDCRLGTSILIEIIFSCHQMGGGINGPGGRRALEIIGSGLKSFARPARPVRRAASRDSVLSQPQPLLEGT